MSNNHITFDDLGEVTVDAVLIRPDGRQLRVPMRTLSEHEVWTLRAAMKWPTQPMEIRRRPPDNEPHPGPVTSGPLYDKYLQEVTAASRLFNRALLVRSLCMGIPGDTDEAKAAALETKLGAWSARQLTDHLNRMLGITETEVDAKAASFLGAADSGTSDIAGTGMDDAEVAQTVTDG